MKDPSLTKTPLLQFLRKLNYLKNKIINLLTLKILFYKTKNNLFKKLYYNQETHKFYNKKNQKLRLIISQNDKRMKIYHPMKM